MTKDSPQTPEPPPPTPAEPSRLLTSAELFRGAREVQIEHEGVVYYLRITRKNRLILHK